MFFLYAKSVRVMDRFVLAREFMLTKFYLKSDFSRLEFDRRAFSFILERTTSQ